MSEHEPASVQEIPRNLSVDDIDDAELHRLCSRVCHVVDRDLDTSVRRIYVMGSFARGEAREVISDIDLRVIIGDSPSTTDRFSVEDALKDDYGPEIVPSVCGYLDAHLAPSHARPGKDEPSTEVWRS